MQNSVQNPISSGQVSISQTPQYVQYPQQCAQQCVQVPNYSGVNIQIFNPSAGAPGAPQYCYPSNYYTNRFGNPCTCNNAYNNTNNLNNNGGSGYLPNNAGANYAANNGINNGLNNGVNNGANANGALNNAANMANGVNNSANNAGTNTSNNAANSASNSINNNTTNNTTNNTNNDSKKTEKRKIVQLTDEYIKTLEDYLNNQDKEIRMMGAKEVAERLQEDESRKDDKALTALINKMLQDPYQPIRFLALAMLDGRCVTGDSYTVQLLKNMQQDKSGYGQDALEASQVLLKMSGQQVEKEFEVKPKKESK